MERSICMNRAAVLAAVLLWASSAVCTAAPITVDGKTYASLGDYQGSEEFRRSDARCGTPEPTRDMLVAALRAASDCDASQSANLGDYPPSVVYTIPVWVHVITADDGTTGDVSDALVDSQIDVLNEDFRALASTPGANGTDVMVQFCLAGMERTASTDYFNECYYNNCNSNDGQNTNEAYKNALNQDPDHYLNIYTKRWSDKSTLLGYATFPWSDAGQPRDGVVINWQNFGRTSPSGPPYDQGRTTTHEVGHYLGLLHTFQHRCSVGLVGESCSQNSHCDSSPGVGDGVCRFCSGDADPACYSQGDLICDTNPEEDPTFGCPSDPMKNSCGSDDPIENYMDYSDDTCMEEFTPEQAARIGCTIENYRADLPGSCGGSPTADPNGPYTGECKGGGTEVSLNGSGSSDPDGDALTYAWTTTCPGGSFDDDGSPTPVLTVDAPAGCTALICGVTLTVTDPSGESDSLSTTVTIDDDSPPELSCPGDVTVECDESTDPGNTGTATATDECDGILTPDASDVVTPGDCPQESTIARTWTASDACLNPASCVQTIEVADTTPPEITCPPDVTIECDESTDPSNTGSATATDNCDDGLPAPAFSDSVTPGDCPQEYVIARRWTSADACGNTASCVQTIKVVDTTAPVIACNAPGTITPADAPISFTATATDNCDDDPSVQVTGFDCYTFTKKGKRIDKTASCVVYPRGDSITIANSGGVGDFIAWTVVATDDCGNEASAECQVEVVNPGNKPEP